MPKPTQRARSSARRQVALGRGRLVVELEAFASPELLPTGLEAGVL
jgi:hypothetical protein